jgi:integrase
MPPDAPSPRPRAHKVAAGTFAPVIRAFLASDKFKGLKPSTQVTYRYVLVRAEQPDVLGAVPIDRMRPALVQGFLDGLADKPGIQRHALTALKSLEKWTLVRDLLTHTITLGCEARGAQGAHEPWSDAEVELAEQNAKPSLARIVTLISNTGQRGSDVVKMRWTDLETYQGVPGINVKQKKTALEIWIPLTAELQRALEGWERRPGYICLKEDGAAWTRPVLSQQWIRERGSNPALAPLLAAGRVIHGLRATACVRLNRSGATARQIADTVGMSIQTVEKYLRKSVQRDNALAAVLHLDRANSARTKARGPSGE